MRRRLGRKFLPAGAISFSAIAPRPAPAAWGERLRAEGLLAGAITIRLDFLRGESWSAETRAAETDSTVAIMRLLDKLWRDRPESRRPLLKVGVVLTRLCGHGNYTPQLFNAVADTGGGKEATDTAKHQRLDATLDKLRARYGRKVVYFGGVQESRDAAPMRIAFSHVPEPGVEGD